MKFKAKSPVLPLLAALMAACAVPLRAEPAAPAPAQSALTSLIGAPHSPLPAGTKVRGINIAGGLATVDFSRELRDDFRGGDTEEAQAVNSILRALGQFPNVDRVQILVNGQSADSLGGLLDISRPLPVIRPNAAPPAPGRYLHRLRAAH